MNKTRLEQMICEQEHLGTLCRREIELMQLRKLNQLLKRETERQGYYKNLPSSIETLEELKNLPFTTARDLECYGDKMVLCSQKEIQRVITDRTSGTTGKPKRMYYTWKDLERTVDLFAAGLGEFVYPDSVTMILMPFSGPYGLGELIAEAITRLGAVPIKCGPGLSYGEYEKIMKDYHPDTYVGTSVTLLSLLRYLGKGSLRRALVSGDACPEYVVSECEYYLRSRLFPHYGSREMALGGAVTCEAHKGMHLRENHVIAEIINEQGQVLPAGQIGELVITTIGMEAQPLIRYRTGDYASILPGRCECGSSLIRLDQIKRISESQMEEMDNLVFSLKEIIDYTVEKNDHSYDFRILVKNQISEAELKEKLQKLLPNQNIHVMTEKCTKNSTGLYSSKRHIQVRN